MAASRGGSRVARSTAPEVAGARAWWSPSIPGATPALVLEDLGAGHGRERGSEGTERGIDLVAGVL